MILKQKKDFKKSPDFTETRLIKAISLLLFSVLFSFSTMAQNIGVNATGAEPDASALLDLSSEDKGFLITRADPLDIVSPAFGLMTLSPKDSCLYMYGKSWIGLGGVGKNCAEKSSLEIPCGESATAIVDVTSTTGKVWMDRNLGASQVATSSKDEAAYGDLYQWGRCTDGHEKRDSETTPTQAISDQTGHSNFIIGSNDWRNPGNDNLWQGAAGINNPCPAGYRIPTDAEAAAERSSWSAQNSVGAFASPLKLTLAGYRNNNTGVLGVVGYNGFYWTSALNGNGLFFDESLAPLFFLSRAHGFSVRCIKD